MYPWSKHSFRAKRSTVDMVFSFSQVQEKCVEQRNPLYIAFNDLTKAFYLLSRDGLFQGWQKSDAHLPCIAWLRSFHDSVRLTHYMKCSQAGICNGPSPVWYFLCSLAQAHFWTYHRRNKHLYDVGWRPFQSLETHGKEQSLVYVYQGTMLHRWCSHAWLNRGRSTATHESLCWSSQRFQIHH